MADTTDLASDPLRLREEFPPVSKADWEAIIQADLKGADYEKKLVWRTEEGIAVRPYYRAEDIADLPNESPVRGKGSQIWQLLPPGTEPPPGSIRADLHHDNGATAVQELAYAIAEGVDRLDAGTDPESLTFVFAVGSNYFFEIAKIRAARGLWAHILVAYGNENPRAMRIHARTALANKSIYDPYTNLLRVTTEALSASIGGVSALEVRPFGFSERLALNVQRIIREESHIDAVADPAGGSYYIEALTDALAREAWTLFLALEGEGGYGKAKATVDAAIAQSRAAKDKAVASRRKTLVGVNNYPNVNEATHEVEPGEGWRAARIIENIRLRTEEHTKKSGRRPKVLLLSRGDLKMRQARAQFCLNFFGCGGFDVVESDGFAGTDADLIVLCSSDPEYLALAQEVCPNVKQPVIVAGNPKEQIDALKAAGVADFVHVLSNEAETLTAWQDRLGIGRAA